jgi:hypothetical protein
LKEPLIDTIFEAKLTYIPVFINQPSLNVPVVYDPDPINSKSIPYEILTQHIRYLFEPLNEVRLFIDSNPSPDVREVDLTIILDMRENQNKLYFKVGGVTINNVICNISHVQKRLNIWIKDAERLKIISLTHLVCLPIDLTKEYTYQDSNTGEIIKMN